MQGSLVDELEHLTFWPNAAFSTYATMQDDDPYNFSEPVNVLDQISKDFWEGLASPKWTERRDALQNLLNLAGKPKLATGDYGDVMRELRKVRLFEA